MEPTNEGEVDSSGGNPQDDITTTTGTASFNLADVASHVKQKMNLYQPIITESLAKCGNQFFTTIQKESWLCAGAIWLIFLVGSFAHDFLDIPQSYFANRRNVLNIYFVKKGWGWTVMLLLQYLVSHSVIKFLKNNAVDFTYLGRLVVTTVMWYVTTNMFLVIERFTGACEGSTFADPASCQKGGYIWSGFDISGHAYLLSFSVLMINEELKDVNLWHTHVLDTFSSPSTSAKKSPTVSIEHWLVFLSEIAAISLALLQFLWLFMLFWTCLYFHTVTQKLLGLLLGLGSWYLSYKYLFAIIEWLKPGKLVREIVSHVNKM